MRAEALDPREDTRPCDCCAAPGCLPFGRVTLCEGCEAAECDGLDPCMSVEGCDDGDSLGQVVS